jgi:aminobenzoyl-glutamate utilization protein B
VHIEEWIDANQKRFTDLSDRVWTLAELGYREEGSLQLLAEALEKAGFKIERNLADIATAFVAEFGNAPRPIIGILGEYDALPGLSQDRVPYQKPLAHDASGHGCGHNLLGAAGIATCLAVREAMAANELKGAIRYYGCPAEEGGAAKAFMAKAGVFNDADICLTWHPDAFNGTVWVNFLANYRVAFKFHGKAAHAASDPYNGRSALDAVELMNVGVNYLREHMIPDARVHYVITHGGGTAPNIVPAEAASLYSVRAPRTDQLNDLYERVKDIARGAALMTGTELEIVFHSGMSNILLNDTVNQVLQKNLERIGAPKFSDAEKEFAHEISKNIPGDSLETCAPLYGLSGDALAALKGMLLFEEVLPPFRSGIVQPGSTDVGDVSWAAPTGQIITTCMALGTPGHSWQLTAQSGMGIGHRGMLYAAKVLAQSAIEFMQNPELLHKAKEEFSALRTASKYVSPIPDGAKPPVEPY